MEPLGFGLGAGPQIVPLVPTPATPSGQSQTAFAIALQSGSVNALIAAIRACYTGVVKPMLSGANSTQTTEDALGEWQLWLQFMDPSILGSFSGQVLSALAPDIADSRIAAAAAIKVEIAFNNSDCITERSLSWAQSVLNWQQQAGAYGLATTQLALDLATVLQGLCVQVRYAAVTLPDTVRPGRGSSFLTPAASSRCSSTAITRDRSSGGESTTCA